MDQNRDMPHGQSNQVTSNARGQQQSKKGWDGNERRSGEHDRRRSDMDQTREQGNTMQMEMNEGSSR